MEGCVKKWYLLLFAFCILMLVSTFSCTELDPHVDDPDDPNYVPTEIAIRLFHQKDEVVTSTTEDSLSIALEVTHLHRIDRIKIDLDLNNADDEVIVIQADDLSIDPETEELVSLIRNHTFFRPGEYIIEVYAYSVNGQDVVDTFTIEIVCAAPNFTVQPQSQETVAPNPVSFTASAAGTAPLTYQWYRLTEQAGSPADSMTYVYDEIVGADSVTYTISRSLPGDENYSYVCIAENACGADTSRIVDLTVENAALSDNNPTVSFRELSSSGNEGENGSIALELDKAYTEEDVVVRIAVMENSTACNGESGDFIVSENTIVFDRGETRAEAMLTILQDGEEEPNEDIYIKIESALFAHIDTTKRIHKYTVIDDDEYPVASFIETEMSGLEGVGAKIKIGLSETFSDDTVKVIVRLAPDNTARNFYADSLNADFVFQTQTISFAPGIQEVTMDSIRILEDRIKESSESFTLQLALPETRIRAQLGQNRECVYTIHDNNTARVLFDGSDKSSIELDSGSIQDSIQIMLSSVSAHEVNVEFAVEATAQSGSDYSFVGEGSLVTFAPGQDTAYIRLTVFGDTIAEGSEYIRITLTEVTEGYELPPEPVFTYFINDNDATTYTFETSESIVYEDTGTIAIPVILTAHSDDTVKVKYDYVAGSAQTVDNDFEFSEGTVRLLTFEPRTTKKFINIDIIDDQLDEPEESFSIELQQIEGNSSPGSITLHTVKIQDNDKAKYRFQTANSEGDETDSVISVPVVLSNPSSANAIRLKFRTTRNSTAQEGNDYTLMAQDTLLFEIGDTIEYIEITMHADEISEFDETIELELEAADTFSVEEENAVTTHVLTIRDANGNPQLNFISEGMDANEGAKNESRTHRIPVCMDFSSAKPVSVKYQLYDSTLAWNGVDCEVSGEVNGVGTLNYEPGQDTAYINVTVLGDSLDESDEAMKIVLHTPQNATVHADNDFIFTVLDDDYTVTVNAGRNGAVEPSGVRILSEGDSLRIMAIPDAHHHFLNWESSQYSLSDSRNDTTYILDITRNGTVYANFGIDTFKVVVNQGENGTISSVVNDSLPYGTVITIEDVIPDENYTFVRWDTTGMIDVTGDITSPDAIFTVRGECTVTPLFDLRGYRITVKAGVNGSVENDSINNVKHGDPLVITAVPQPHYYFVKWKVTGGLSANRVVDTLDATTTINAIDANGSVTAIFEVDKHIITVSSAGYGTVDPDTASIVNHFDSLRIRALEPDSAYHFAKWRIISGKDSADITDSLASVTYVKNITGTSEIHALFVKDTFNLFVTSDIYGTANDEGIRKVAFRESTTISAGLADSVGYEFSHWDIGHSPKFEMSADDIHKHTVLVKNVTGNDTITAVYVLKTCTLSVSANQYGTSDPNGEIFIQHFGSQIIRAANPEPGYEFTEWSIVEGDRNIEIEEPNKDSTRIINITGNGSVRANFARIRYAITVTSGEGGSAVNENIERSVPYMDTTHISIDETDVGWEFQQWVVDDDQKAEIDNPGAPSTYVKNVSGDAIITAVFARRRYPLTVIQPGAGGTITDPSGGPLEGEYEHGTVLDIKVILSRGYGIDSWAGDGTGYGETTNITMNGPRSIEINLIEIPVPSHVICVDAASSYSGNVGWGSTWARAYKTIQAGLTSLHDNADKTQLWVAGGTYTIPATGFELEADDTLYGGFFANETSLANDRIFYEEQTILDASLNGSGNVFKMYNDPHVLIDGFVMQESQTASITITEFFDYGGGTKISNCVFRNASGYALSIEVPDVTVENCVFRDNSGFKGTCISISKGNLIVENSIFYNNDGPCISDNNVSSDHTVFNNCTFYKNQSDDMLPGAILSKGNIRLNGCILDSNSNVGGWGTQIDSVKYVKDCNIQDASTSGVGNRLPGSWENVISVDSDFPANITSDDSDWFRETSSAVLIPGNSLLFTHCEYGNKPVRDLRGKARSRSQGFTPGSYEAY